MAGPVRISILADVSNAVKGMTRLQETTEEAKRVVTGLGDSRMTGGFGKAQGAFDVLDTRAMGFRDTITGVQDSVKGVNEILAKPTDAKGWLDLGMGVGDLASGFANFLLPLVAMSTMLPVVSTATKVWTGIQAAFNFVMAMNPIVLIIIAIILLIAIIVVAWQHSDTFREIVTNAFNTVWNAIKAVWNWLKENFPKLWHIITDPFFRGVDAIRTRFAEAVEFVKGIPGKVVNAFGNANQLLINVGRDIARGLINGINNMIGSVADKAREMGRAASNAVKGALGIASPSRVMRQMGEYTGEGFALGLAGSVGDVAKTATALAGAALAGASGVVGVAASVDLNASAPPVWAQRLIELLDGGLTLTLESSGSRGDDAVLELIRDRVRVKGGSSSLLGVTRLA